MLSIGVEGLLEIAISPVGLITWEAIPDTGNNPKVVMTAIVRGDRTNLLVKSVFERGIALSVRGGINTHLISFMVIRCLINIGKHKVLASTRGASKL